MTEATNRIPFGLDMLHPVMVGPIRELTATMMARDVGGFILNPFEGYRTPMRQHHLLTRTKSTKAGPWKSAHQYGMAVDFAGLRIENNLIVPGSWAWDQVPKHLWETLKREAVRVGLDVPIAWDKGHVIHPDVTRLFGIK